jgi:hypothetical protein
MSTLDKAFMEAMGFTFVPKSKIAYDTWYRPGRSWRADASPRDVFTYEMSEQWDNATRNSQNQFRALLGMEALEE